MTGIVSRLKNAIATCEETSLDQDALEEIERLRALLLEAKRPHYVCDGDCWYSCPASGECCDKSAGRDCDCGADAWNAKVDTVLGEVS